MATPRFYVPQPLSAGALPLLPDDVAHHAIRVLRLEPGAPILLFNGEGGVYQAALQVQGKQAYAAISAFDPAEAELAGHLTLVQGIAAGDKMDWIIEKAVELGAAAVVPIAARRSVLRLSGSRLEKRVQHWRRIARAACEQCGRNRLPHIAEPMPLGLWLERPPADSSLRLLCHPEAEPTLAAALAGQPPASLQLLVGPEGGWADEELELADRHGARRVRFGPRVLRTETAGVALIAAATALLGW